MPTASGCFPKFAAKFALTWITVVLPLRGVAGSGVESWGPGLLLRPRGGCGGASLQSCRGRSLLPGERPHGLQAVATVEGLEDGGRRPLRERHGQGRRSDRRGKPLQQWGPLAMGWERRPCQFGQAGVELPDGFPRLLGPRVEPLSMTCCDSSGFIMNARAWYTSSKEAVGLI